MKKLLLSTIIFLIVVLIGVTVVRGFEIGKLNILGIKDIKKENEDLDERIKEATKLASTDYQKKKDELDETIKKLSKTYFFEESTGCFPNIGILSVILYAKNKCLICKSTSLA